MFKVIYKHTKPLKHAKYIETLTNTLKKHDFSKILSWCLKLVQKYMRSGSPNKCYRIFSMFSIIWNCPKPFIKLKSTCFDHFSLMFFGLFSYFLTFCNKSEIAKLCSPRLQTSPACHIPRNLQILTNYINKNTIFQKFLQLTMFRSTFQKLSKS